ncbi:MAG: heme ABC exporter ATP-binding protein CcmA [Pseudomonadota bacterium]|nr:heme ABC exporter ATP-binding protein CcmA [Pseudomonadota bacterium]
MKPLLELRSVTLRRGGRILLEAFNLRLGAGEALHLAGPNGSGKSSLIRLAAGLLRPERGSVKRADAALADDVLALDREQPLRDALAFWAGLQRRAGEVNPALELVGLADLAAVPVRLLSAGQAKRAALARVALSGAPLWLLDEPYNALDSQSSQRLDVMMGRHLADGGAILLASHGTLAGNWPRLELGA